MIAASANLRLGGSEHVRMFRHCPAKVRHPILIFALALHGYDILRPQEPQKISATKEQLEPDRSARKSMNSPGPLETLDNLSPGPTKTYTPQNVWGTPAEGEVAKPQHGLRVSKAPGLQRWWNRASVHALTIV